MRGSLSGRQEIVYASGSGYDVPLGDVETSTNYQPILVAQFSRKKNRRSFQIRSKTSVNMTASVRLNLATMGGAGALYAALVSDKTTQLYNDCVHACPVGKTLREFIVPALRDGLAAKISTITIATGIVITNPWRYSGTQTLTISQLIIDKFSDQLS